MTNLQRYENEGLELLINQETGEVFCSQGMLAKMCNTESTQIRRFRGDSQELKNLPVLDSRGVIQEIKLYPEKLIRECFAKFNPELLLKCSEKGLRYYLHELAGYEVKSTAINSYILPQTYLEALEALVASEKQKLLLESQKQKLIVENKVLDNKLIEVQPKVEFANTIATSEDVLSWNDFAKIIGIGRNTMLAKLRSLRILNGNNVPYQTYLDRDYFEVTETKTPVGIRVTTRVTGKGQIWLTKKLTK